MTIYASTRRLLDDVLRAMAGGPWDQRQHEFLVRIRADHYHAAIGAPLDPAAALVADLSAHGLYSLIKKAQEGYYEPGGDEPRPAAKPLPENLAAGIEGAETRARQYAPELSEKTEQECLDDIIGHLLYTQLWLTRWMVEHADSPTVLHAGPEARLAAQYTRQLSHYVQAIWPLGKEAAAELQISRSAIIEAGTVQP